jgi:hypothetical protein
MTPEVSSQTALKQYLASILQLQSLNLATRVQVACSSPPSISVLEQGLISLSDCNVQLLTLIRGSYHTLGCSADLEGPHLVPLAMMNAVPDREGVRSVEIKTERSNDGRLGIQLRCPIVTADGKPSGKSSPVVWRENEDGGAFVDDAAQEGIAEWYSLEFTERDSRSFTISLPPIEGVDTESNRQLVLKDGTDSDATAPLLVDFQIGGARGLLWKVNPICCPHKRNNDVWDFFKEDRTLSCFTPAL